MMPVDRELILLAQASKRFVLPACAVVVDEIECFRLHNKKTTIDNLPVARVLFAKASGPRTIGRQVDCAEAAGKLNQAPVTVTITTGSVSNALTVPVDALLAEPGGKYAVEVTGPGGHHLVTVTPGMFDDAAGKVQVSGNLTAGQHVVVPGI